MGVVARSRERGCGILALQVRMGTRETGAYSVLEPEDLDLFWQVSLPQDDDVGFCCTLN